MLPPRKIPSATYRLQLRAEFPLDAARTVVRYLSQLGISDLYLSPLYTAAKGSPHGYDIVDHARLNPELGDAAALGLFLDQVGACGMGFILDVVPNHMCISSDANALWMDVLEHGRASAKASSFDIDWEPPKPELVGKVLLPVLGEQYGRVLEHGISVHFDRGRFFATCVQRRLPLSPESWRHILEPTLALLRAAHPPEFPDALELESIERALTAILPPLRQGGAACSLEFRHESEAIRHRLEAIVGRSAVVRSAVDDVLRELNGIPGQSASFDRLERLMDEQNYRLAYWRVAAHEVNYRRFFDINDLAAVRVEEPAVFDEVHVLAFQIARHPAFCGFRIDHVDGLSDPAQYLRELRSRWRQASTPDDVTAARPFVLVEKILGPDETLPADWVADGTTGYDFIAAISRLFVRADGYLRLRALAADFGGARAPFDVVAYQSKSLVLQTTLAAELTVLARRLDRISEQHRYTRDFTLNHLQQALGEVIACFPVYRTYIRRDSATVSAEDAAHIGRALAAARRRNPWLNSSLFDFIESILMLHDPGGLDPAQVEERRTFVVRFQQLTGPVVAKGVEDTAFYRYLPLIALNEVGGNPELADTPDGDAHKAFRARREQSPHTLSATATHDTKRGEDTRTRLYALSEIADAWARAIADWSNLTAGYKTKVDGSAAPDPAEEYLLYQTLVGTWPLGGWQSEPDYADRIRAYMSKARHEAKMHTSWINPNRAYDAAAEAFVDAVLDTGRSASLLKSVEVFARSITGPGLWTSLAQVVTKIAAPGIPDFLQGTELWDFSLVDPDNRRLVDFARREEWLTSMLADVEAGGHAPIQTWFANPSDGRIKLWTTAAALRLRRARRALFEAGAYEPLISEGRAQAHVFAFARTHEGEAAVAIVGRFFAAFGSSAPVGRAWADTRVTLPPAWADRRFRDGLTGQVLTAAGPSLDLSAVLNVLPVALLESLS